MFFRSRYRKRSWGWTALRAIPAVSKSLIWLPRLLLLLLLVDLFYVATIWPDWSRYKQGPIPKSSFMHHYQLTRHKVGGPPIKWQPVALDEIPPYLQRAVVVAEDSRFYQHDGFDLVAFKEAMDYNLTSGRPALGASTISQQTVKNMFLSSRRDPLRKWHELLLTWGMEHNLRKNRILEIYLNIAEFGQGIYGVQAASEHYWSKPVSELNLQQAMELAATLPAPKKQNPITRGKGFERRLEKIVVWMNPPAS
jgi:monofunctional biosynthetic peptidoglycan transglycosylase